MIYKILALVEIFELTFPAFGPGTSAFITNIELPRDFGIIAIINERIPIPPIQWVKLLQKRIDFGIELISLNIDAPVVVKPDAVSKKASIKLGIQPLKTNGSAPKTETSIQPTPQITRPSFAKILTELGFFAHRTRPNKRDNAIGITNEGYSVSLKPCIL